MQLDPVDHSHVLAVVHQNPRRPNEGALSYAARIAVLAGLLEPGEVGDAPVGGWSSAGDVMAAPETPTGEEYWNR